MIEKEKGDGTFMTHWVGLVVDAKENNIHHGNSLGSSIPWFNV
jgi:hypothetical protein